ncbi:hypothetical protein MTO96_034102 [Rhipicephalus appendiculatus]
MSSTRRLQPKPEAATHDMQMKRRMDLQSGRTYICLTARYANGLQFPCTKASGEQEQASRLGSVAKADCEEDQVRARAASHLLWASGREHLSLGRVSGRVSAVKSSSRAWQPPMYTAAAVAGSS